MNNEINRNSLDTTIQNPQTEMTEEEILDIAKNILNKYIEAFKELAK